ncbi:MAG: ATP-binding cassette domain-containing protein [Gemmatimonadota bacterium]
MHRYPRCLRPAHRLPGSHPLALQTPCWSSTTSQDGSVRQARTSRPCETSRSRSRRAASGPSSARTARARPRCSAWRWAFCARRRVRAALHALARLDGLDARRARARTDAVLEQLGLDAYAERPVGALSRGLLQRVGLAQALLADRPIVVLDEPTEGLDPLWRIRLRELIAGLRQRDRLVLVASHALAEVERVADRVVLLEEGRVRDILDVATPSGPTRYRIRLAHPSTAVADVFPDSKRTTAAEYVVVVSDPAELSQRLAALLVRDVTLVEATPLVEPLEDRVRRALEGGRDDDGTAGEGGDA